MVAGFLAKIYLELFNLGMLDNHLYNLLNQITQEHKSLWRIKNAYKQDAASCPACQAFWQKLESDKEGHIQQLTELIKTHLK